MKSKLLVLFCGIALFGRTQNFTHSLSVMSSTNGLQALAISPELKNIAESNFKDVRLYDKNRNEVPYFLVTENFLYSSTQFREYEISDTKSTKGSTSFIVHNPEKKAMQNIILSVVNSDAVKLCDITGSDDGKQWFPVSNDIWLYNLYDENDINAYRSIAFPMVNYKLIRIDINDLFTLPLNILKVGYFEGAVSAGKLNSVETKMTYRTDKVQKKSFLDFEFENYTPVDRLTFKIKSPSYFKREAKLTTERIHTVKHQEEKYTDIIQSFELNSDKQNSIDLSGFREKKFTIEIVNQDNPPLELDSVLVQQLQTYLVADFKENENYSLMAGNRKLSFPVYDIGFFRNKISQFLPTLTVSPLTAIKVAEQKIIVPEKSFWQEAWFMWTCIAVASLMLLVFSLRILKDIKEKG